MNYRHAFHAGNIGDVLKHLVLAAVIERLAAKPAPIMVLDTHAGAGRYMLDPAGGEWQDGVGRLMRHAGDAWPAVAQPYRRLVAPGMEQVPAFYPGSPLIALGMLRDQDRLIACETVEPVAAELRAALRGEPRAAVHVRDGWEALRAFLPPRSGRALVLIDPPFEAAGEFDLLARHLAEAARRAPTAVILGWYPVKGTGPSRRLKESLAGAGIPKVLAAELLAQPADDPGRFAGSGMIVIRPPWQLDAALAQGLPKLLDLAGFTATGTASARWLAGEAEEAW